MRYIAFLILTACVAYAQPAATGRTLWLNASDADHLFTDLGPPPTGTPADEDAVLAWTDEDANSTAIRNETSATPTYESTGMNSLSSLEFDGLSDVLRLDRKSVV